MDSAPARRARSRAPRACQACRFRKLRCVTGGHHGACVACMVGKRDCVFVFRSRREYIWDGPDHIDEPTSSVSPNGPERSSRDNFTPATTTYPRSIAEPLSSDATEDVPVAGGSWLSGPPSNQEDIRPVTELSGISKSVHEDYAFLELLTTGHVSQDEARFLHDRGCLYLPGRAILDEFIQQFFLHVHPMLPLLDESDFWALYHDRNVNKSARETLSLVLLQGIMFASCSFVSQRAIELLGFGSIHQAKAAFYKNTELLYDFESSRDWKDERSSIHLAQAALLLSHSHSAACRRSATDWLDNAIRHARNANAHGYQSYTFKPNTEPAHFSRLKSALKRLWWCCIIRDRIMPLTSRRSIRISRQHFDFDGSVPLGTPDLSNEIHGSRVYDSRTKLYLAEILTRLTELCVILTDILSAVFSVHDNPWHPHLGGNTCSFHTKGMQKALDMWHRDFLKLQAALSEEISSTPEISQSSPRESVILFNDLVNMYYHSARLLVRHYGMYLIGIDNLEIYGDHSASDSRLGDRDELLDATNEVAQCLEKLSHLRLVQFLPVSAIGITALPLALHILDEKLWTDAAVPGQLSSATSSEVQHRRRRLSVLIEAMKTYRPRHDGVDWLAQVTRHVVTAAQQHLPVQKLISTRPTATTTWTDILAAQPSFYLRFAMTLDLGIRSGKLPEENDFPPGLRGIFSHEYPWGLSNFIAGETLLSLEIPEELYLGSRAPEAEEDLESGVDLDGFPSRAIEGI